MACVVVFRMLRTSIPVAGGLDLSSTPNRSGFCSDCPPDDRSRAQAWVTTRRSSTTPGRRDSGFVSKVLM